MLKKTIAFALLGLLSATSAQAKREPIRETYTQLAKIKEITAGTGHSYNHSKRQYDKGLYLRIETDRYFEGYCIDGAGTKRAFTKSPNTKYMYLEGTSEQLAAWVPILTEIMESGEERELLFHGEECMRGSEGVSFAGIRGKY